MVDISTMQPLPLKTLFLSLSMVTKSSGLKLRIFGHHGKKNHLWLHGRYIYHGRKNLTERDKRMRFEVLTTFKG